MQYKIPNYLNILADENAFFIKSNKIVSKILSFLLSKYTSEEISNKYGISRRLFYYYLNAQRSISLSFLVDILHKEQLNLHDELFNSFDEVSTAGHSSTRLLKCYSSDLAYLSGLIIGDGHISKRTEVGVAGDSKIHLNIALKMIERLFDYTPQYFDYITWGRMYISSKSMNLFFNKVIGIPKGKKKLIKIPKFIYLSKDFKKMFIRGMFDSDGGVTLSKKGRFSILISSSDHPYLLEIKSLLTQLGINLTGPYHSGNRKGFELRSMCKPEIIRFNKEIGSYHPKKIARLAALVA